MNKYQIGDKVKFLNEEGYGVITKIIDNSKINYSPTASDISFVIGPQLNAASRVDDSSLSHKLLYLRKHNSHNVIHD